MPPYQGSRARYRFELKHQMHCWSRQFCVWAFNLCFCYLYTKASGKLIGKHWKPWARMSVREGEGKGLNVGHGSNSKGIGAGGGRQRRRWIRRRRTTTTAMRWQQQQQQQQRRTRFRDQEKGNKGFWETNEWERKQERAREVGSGN